MPVGHNITMSSKGQTIAASAPLVVAVGGNALNVALNLLLAYPLYGLCRRIFPVVPRERREVIPVRFGRLETVM